MRSPAASISDAVKPAQGLHSDSALNHRAEPLWPEVVVALGLGLSTAWTIFLGYELTKLVQLVFELVQI